MVKSDFKFELKKYETKDVSDGHINGSLVVIWRDWDKILQHTPKMVYVSSVNPNQIKGPHVHTRRNSYFVCLSGKVVFIIKKNDGTFEEIISSEHEPNIIYVPKMFPSAHINLSKNISRILVMADVSWKPNDNEMHNTLFENYDWKKWKV